MNDTLQIQGMKEFDRLVSGIARRCDKERRNLMLQAARETLVPAMKADAKRSPGRAGAILAQKTTARKGREDSIVVGPKGGKGGAWWKAFFITGSKAHTIGAAHAGGPRTFYSAARARREANWKRTRGGLFTRTSAGRERVFLSNIGYPNRALKGPFMALGPVHHGPIAPNPFVKSGADRAGKYFVDGFAGLIFGTRSQGASSRPNTFQP